MIWEVSLGDEERRNEGTRERLNDGEMERWRDQNSELKNQTNRSLPQLLNQISSGTNTQKSKAQVYPTKQREV